MKREVLFIFLMVVGLLTGCQAAGPTSPELPTPGKFIFDRRFSDPARILQGRAYSVFKICGGIALWTRKRTNKL